MKPPHQIAVKAIRTEDDYSAALERIATLTNATAGSPEGIELAVLMDLVEHYEDRRHPIDPPDPIEAIKFRMDQAGLKNKDLVGIIGPSGRVSEVLAGRRGLTKEMIRRLHERLGIPVESLIGPMASRL